jgi:hypothetical protein
MAPWLLLVVLSGPQFALASADCWTPQEGVAIYEDGENATIFDTCNATATQCPPVGEVTICPNVTIIPLCSFAGCHRITLLNISDSVTEIGVAAFENNQNSVPCAGSVFSEQLNDTISSCGVQEIVFGRSPSLMRIGEAAFKFNEQLREVSLPNSVTEIGPEAFEYCDDLATVNVGSGVEVIGKEAFKDTGLTEFVMPHSVHTVGDYAFYYCDDMTTLNLSNQLAAIPSGFCSHCDSLSSVDIPDSVTEIGQNAFYYCNDMETATFGPNSTLEVIGEQAFQDCHSLTEFVMPHSVRTVGDDAFNDCADMTTLNISNRLTAIPSGFCKYCDSLTGVHIPDSVTMIGDEAFEYCYDLEIVTFGPNTSLEVIEEQAFKDSGLVTFVMPDSVHSVGPSTFEDSESLLSITLSNQLTAISVRFCHGCESLTGIHIPDSVTEIGGETFEHCYDLVNLTLPNNLTTIPLEFCQDCGLTSLHIPDSVVYIGNEAFDRCEYLVNVTFGSRVRTIGSQAFQGCESLPSISLPDSVELIGEEAFEGLGINYDDVVVTLGAGVRQIGESAFRDSPIHEIVFPDGLQRIGRSAFQDTELTNVTIPASVSVVEGRAFLVAHLLEYCEQGENVSYEECVDDPSEGGSCPDLEDFQEDPDEECEDWLAVTDNVSYPSGPCCVCGGGRIEPSELPYDRDLTHICLSSFDCSGSVYINETMAGESEDCFPRGTRRVTVDTSHCGFVTTPEIYIFDANLVVYNCSHVVNPSPVSFEMWCILEPDFPDFGYASRRLGSSFYYYDDEKVVTWGASEPAYVDECNNNIDDLNDRISDLEDTLDSLRTTVTTTTTAVSATTVTTATRSTVTATTGTATTTTAVPAATAGVLAAGVATDCKSLLGFLIASWSSTPS